MLWMVVKHFLCIYWYFCFNFIIVFFSYTILHLLFVQGIAIYFINLWISTMVTIVLPPIKCNNLNSSKILFTSLRFYKSLIRTCVLGKIKFIKLPEYVQLWRFSVICYSVLKNPGAIIHNQQEIIKSFKVCIWVHV